MSILIKPNKLILEKSKCSSKYSVPINIVFEYKEELIIFLSFFHLLEQQYSDLQNSSLILFLVFGYRLQSIELKYYRTLGHFSVGETE